MTTLIRMNHHITGGRHDGRPWPDPALDGGLIDVPDWEAQDLIRGRMATLADTASCKAWAKAHETAVQEAQEDAEAQAVQAEALAEGPGPETAMSPPDPRAEVSSVTPSFEAEEEARPPSPSSPKQDWIDYAVSTGQVDVHGAQAMTKADLMSRFGGRL